MNTLLRILITKIYVKNLNTGKVVSITTTISGNTLTIKCNRVSNDSYLVYIPSGAVKGANGLNLTTAYSYEFSSGSKLLAT